MNDRNYAMPLADVLSDTPIYINISIEILYCIKTKPTKREVIFKLRE